MTTQHLSPLTMLLSRHTRCRIASIGLNHAMILPTAPNPGRMELFGQDSRLFIGMLVSAPHAETFRLWQLLRAWSSQEVDRSPAAATVNFRAEVQQVGCPR